MSDQVYAIPDDHGYEHAQLPSPGETDRTYQTLEVPKKTQTSIIKGPVIHLIIGAIVASVFIVIGIGIGYAAFPKTACITSEDGQPVQEGGTGSKEGIGDL